MNEPERTLRQIRYDDGHSPVSRGRGGEQQDKCGTEHGLPLIEVPVRTLGSGRRRGKPDKYGEGMCLSDPGAARTDTGKRCAGVEGMLRTD
jgi:hypothetical protein